jgi:serine/threonine protein kinase
MGAVYLAHRIDGEFHHRVAIKIIGLHLEAAEMRKRFRRERQILAGLQHPNITRLLDGGITSDGQLYLVMEYVEGVPVTKFSATLETKLQLFQSVCAAVQYAHQNLVIHRDIKPSNILVDRAGTPKLLDFGAATLQDETDATQTGLGMFTIAYAGPEQLRGEKATTLSDVFSLGAVLYELITGQKPFGDSLTTRLRQSEAGELRLPKRLPGDLDTIIRKAMADRPAHRYQSVDQLAEDLRRYGTGEPVVAHAPSFSYRASRFLRRRWLPMTALLAFIFGLAGSTLVAVRQERVAQNEAARQKKLTNFMAQMLSNGGRSEGDIPFSKVLSDAEPLVEQSFKDDPETEASLRMNLGASFTMLGKPERATYQMQKALALLRAAGNVRGEVVVLWLLGQTSQAHLQQTVRYYQEAVDLVSQPATNAKPIWIFRAKRELGYALLLTSNHRSKQDLERERGLLEDAVRIGAANSSIPKGELLPARCSLAEVLMHQGKSTEAEAELAGAESLLPSENRDDYRCRILITRALLAAQRRDFLAAWQALRQSYELNTPWRSNPRPSRYAYFLAETGEVPEALALVLKDLPELRSFKNEQSLFEPLADVAHVMVSAGRYNEAEGYARELWKLLDDVHREDVDPDRAEVLELLGSALSGQKRYKEAIPLFKRSEEAYRRSGPGFLIAARHVAALSTIRRP